MTQEEILEYNKLCAEFLGFKRYPIKDKNDGFIVDWKNGFVPYESCLNSLEFHSDWNWIMEVIESIEKLKDTQGYRYRVDIYVESCNIQCTHNFDSLITINSTSKKEAVVQAIDSFLKFYNKNLEMSI